MHTCIRPTRLVLAAALVATAFTSGCATASKPAAMVPAAVTVERQHPHTVSVKVDGGRETSSMGASQISSEDFATALRTGIENSKLFAHVLGDGADYRIDVLITRLEQPMMGFSMTVTFEANWTLTRVADGKAVWQRAIPTTFTAKMGEAFAGVTRLRLANEGAARANIEAALQAMGALDLE